MTTWHGPYPGHVHKWQPVDGRVACATCGRAKLKEADFRRQVVDLAEATGWEHVGFRPAMTQHGWRTPGTGTMAKGWVDLVLVSPRRHRLLFIELKGDGGVLDPAQRSVLDILHCLDCPTVETFLWSPDDLPEVQAVLTR